MMAVLGIGSGVALFSTINIIVVDSLPNIKFIFLTAIGCMVGFLVGLVYVTPVSYLLRSSYNWFPIHLILVKRNSYLFSF